MNNHDKTRIVIIGGGFAGLFSARHLRKQLGNSADIELISDINYFVFQPLLPEVVAGTINAQDAVSPLRRLLPGIKVRLATVQGIDTDTKTIQLVQGRKRKLMTIGYDQLVITTGQVTHLSMFPGFSEHSLTMKNLSDAHRLRNQIIQCMEAADITENPDLKRQMLTFVIAGGGFSGVETAGEMVEMIHRVRHQYPNIQHEDIRTVLIQRGNRLLPEMSEKLSAYTLKKLEQRGVEVWLNTGIESASRYYVFTADGRKINTGTIVTTIGNGPSAFVQGLPVTLERGKIPVNRDLTVAGVNDIWALGDVALIPLDDSEKPSYAPPTAQFASREAKTLAHNLDQRLRDKTTKPFVYKANGSLASLGGYSGVVEVFGISITGFPAWFLWRFIYIGLLPGFSSRLRVALNWLFDYFMPRTIVSMGEASNPASAYMRFTEGEAVHERDEILEGFYIVCSGSFERTLETDDGKNTAEFIAPVIAGVNAAWQKTAYRREKYSHSKTVRYCLLKPKTSGASERLMSLSIKLWLREVAKRLCTLSSEGPFYAQRQTRRITHTETHGNIR